MALLAPGAGMVERPRIRRRGPAGPAAGLAGVHPLLARLYAARGIVSTDQIDTRLARMLPVSAFRAAGEAAALLERHAGGRVLVVGDFDADGATSTAVVLRTLQALGYPDTDFLVPNRFEFGYGLSRGLTELALETPPDLIVTVDNGISSFAGVELARSRGVDVLVTDHHLPPETPPPANVIANPNMPGETFAGGTLAGVGVAFYVMAALARRRLGETGCRPLLAGLLDLVALGTVADLVPLDQNNRVLVEQGLARIRQGRCAPGVAALLAGGGRDPARAVASDLGFVAGPRLNAAGRLEDMSVGIRCLLTDDPGEARALACVLGDLNEERKAIEAAMQAQAQEAVASLHLERGGALPAVLCLHAPDWHQGVVGLVASRVKDRTHRPVVAFARAGDGELKGSARSIRGLHIRDALAEVDAAAPGLIRRFGGHAMAAGLSLRAEGLDEFRQALEEVVGRHLGASAFAAEILTDGELGDGELDLETAEMLRRAGPWGQAFPEPVFDGAFRVESLRVLKERHLKLRLLPEGGRTRIDALAFNQAAALAGSPPNRSRICPLRDVNEPPGLPHPQLVVEYLEPL